jgi:hypothetical protein
VRRFIDDDDSICLEYAAAAATVVTYIYKEMDSVCDAYCLRMALDFENPNCITLPLNLSADSGALRCLIKAAKAAPLERLHLISWHVTSLVS